VRSGVESEPSLEGVGDCRPKGIGAGCRIGGGGGCLSGVDGREGVGIGGGSIGPGVGVVVEEDDEATACRLVGEAELEVRGRGEAEVESLADLDLDLEGEVCKGLGVDAVWRRGLLLAVPLMNRPRASEMVAPARRARMESVTPLHWRR
jgi:hypothetical protein